MRLCGTRAIFFHEVQQRNHDFERKQSTEGPCQPARLSEPGERQEDRSIQGAANSMQDKLTPRVGARPVARSARGATGCRARRGCLERKAVRGRGSSESPCYEPPPTNLA